jgi:cell division protein FtsB
MDKDYFNILIVGHTTFGIRNLRIKKETFKILIYLLALFQLVVTFCLCDYIQVKKKSFLLNQLRHESLVQKAHIQSFSTNIEDLERRLSKLKDFDQKIRTIANLERGHDTTPFIGMGGSPSPVITWKLKEEPKRSE